MTINDIINKQVEEFEPKIEKILYHYELNEVGINVGGARKDLLKEFKQSLKQSIEQALEAVEIEKRDISKNCKDCGEKGYGSYIKRCAKCFSSEFEDDESDLGYNQAIKNYNNKKQAFLND